MPANSYLTLAFIYTCLHMAHICLACVFLLNGWTALSIKERAELAEIVGAAKVLRTFKEQPAEDDTYTAEVKIFTLYKGHGTMHKVTDAVAPSNVYNVSNFGNKTKCFADVEAGQKYILFLTIFDRKLTAQYDDLFGAAELFSEEAEQEMLTYLGWNPWQEWGPCSVSCGTGTQYRLRDCPNTNGTQCVGEAKECRSCNEFGCQGVHLFDLLTATGARKLPRGVRLNPNRTTAYVIQQNAKLSVRASRFFYSTFPTNFSILLQVKAPNSRRARGYFMTVTDSRGRQQLAIFFGRKLKFQYLGNNYSFKVGVLDNLWHNLAFKVIGSELYLYEECDVIVKRRLRQSGDYLGTDLILSIGPFLPKFGNPFQGQIEQLLLSSDPNVSSKQCGSVFLQANDSSEPNDSATTFGEQNLTTGLPATNTTNLYKDDCKHPCYNDGECIGKDTCSCSSGYTGSQCETPLCPDGCDNGGQCIASSQCACLAGFYGRRCQFIRCRPRCKNGGVCVSPGVCACKVGFSGKRCQKGKCQKGCLNDGKCSPNGKCVCPPPFYGRRCHKERCRLTCFYGGRCVNRQCQCPPGFAGKRCERRSCSYQPYMVPYRRTYRKMVREEFPIPCPHLAQKTCTKTRLKYILITKDTYRTAYRCV